MLLAVVYTISWRDEAASAFFHLAGWGEILGCACDFVSRSTRKGGIVLNQTGWTTGSPSRTPSIVSQSVMTDALNIHKGRNPDELKQMLLQRRAA